ncbi:hypothetical protein [Escherichia coli]|uniref:hypothetical protein n=1 Tax=Escherichia coli TaxID=562 RepID=UPI0012FE2F79|nr:hypothetical protein [Escherichia coli]MVV97815.1 hypothetical protein [Escherichia coli]MWP12164.1 hypothetical protein [Escherichia coli]
MVLIVLRLIIATLLLHSFTASGRTEERCDSNSANSFVSWTESEPRERCYAIYQDFDPYTTIVGQYITIGDNKTPMTIYLGSQNIGNANPHQTAVIGLQCRGLTSGTVYQGQYTLNKPHAGAVTQQLGWTERMECEVAGRILNDTAQSFAPTLIRIGTPDGNNTFTMTTPMQTQVGDWIAPELSVEPKSLRLQGIVGRESPEDKFLIKFKNGYTENLIYPMIRMTTEPSYLLLQVDDVDGNWREANGYEITLPRTLDPLEQGNIDVKVRAVDKGHAYKKQLTLRVEVVYEL